MLILLLALTTFASEAALYVKELPVKLEGLERITGLLVGGKSYLPLEEFLNLTDLEWFYDEGRVYVTVAEEEHDEYDLWDPEQNDEVDWGHKPDEYDLWDHETGEMIFDDEDDDEWYWDDEWEDYDWDDDWDWYWDEDDWDWEEDGEPGEWFIWDYEFVDIVFLDDDLSEIIPGALFDGELYIALREFLEGAGFIVNYVDGEAVISLPREW